MTFLLMLRLFAGRLLTFLRGLPWQAWAALALLAGGLFYGHLRYNAGQANVQAKFDAYRADIQAQADKAAADARGKEQAQRADFAAIQSKLVSENADAHAEIDRLSADLAAGRVRLRSRFACRPVLPAAAAGAPGSSQAGEGGLRDADAEFLVRLAGQADDTARQLATCQAILKSERSPP